MANDTAARGTSMTIKTGLPGVDCSVHAQGTPPLFIEARTGAFADLPSAVAWFDEQRPTIDDLVLQHGGVVFRGFPVVSAQDFEAVAGVFPNYAPGYTAGGSPRDKVTGNILEATRLDAPITIGVHSEMNYLRDYPPRIFFFCKTKAERGGETTIADLRRATRNMPDCWRRKVKALRVRTVRNYSAPANTMSSRVAISDQMPWDKGFNTTDRVEVERICTEVGLDYHWNDDGGLAVISLVDGYVRHPVTGQEIYRAAVHAPAVKYSPAQARLKEAALAKQKIRSGYTLGDGSTGTEEERTLVKLAIDDATLAWPWRNGDMMLLDNLQIWHGRNPYEGEHREVLVALLN